MFMLYAGFFMLVLYAVVPYAGLVSFAPCLVSCYLDPWKKKNRIYV